MPHSRQVAGASSFGRHVGKEGNELEAHRAGVVMEAERQLEYHDSAFEDLIAALQVMPTKAIVEATGYNPGTVRRLKHGEFRPKKCSLRRVVELLACDVKHDELC
jgi:hypothetical protein